MQKLELDRNIFLIGFMGTGKSTISDYMKREYGMDVLEMDEEIVKRENMSIPDIFRIKGEEYFRTLETNLLKEMQGKKNVIVSCGGGVAMRDCNVTEMKKNGKIVLLTASPETILMRTKGDHNRPLLEGKKNVDDIAKLLEERRPKYEAAADVQVATDNRTTKEICEDMIRKLMA